MVVSDFLGPIFNRETISSFAEPDLCTRVLVPLLRKLGYDDATYNHGPNERGKDIIGSRKTRDDRWQNTAIVAKAKEIKGTTTYKEVGGQVRDALGSKFRAPLANDLRTVTDVYVITNKRFAPDAKDKVLSQSGVNTDPLIEDRIHFYDLDWIWENWSKHFPTDPMSVLTHGYQILLESGLPTGSRISVSGTDGKYEIR